MMRPSRTGRHVVVAAFAAAIVATGCGGSTKTAARGDAAAVAAPDTLPLEPVTASDVHQRVLAPGARATLVNVWATWCEPCRAEFPALVSLADRERARGLRVLFVSADFDDQAAATKRFLAQHHAPGPWLVKTGRDQEFIDGLDPRWSGALPVTIVYDPAGKPVQFWEGGADSARFAAAVAPLLEPPAR